MRTRVSFLSVSRSSSRARTAAATWASKSAAEAMRVQLAQWPQKPAKVCPSDQRSRGWRSHSIDMASMRASGDLAAPEGPAGADEGVGQPATGDGSTERLDGGGVADEVVEVGGQRGWGGHGLHWMIRVQGGGKTGERGRWAGPERGPRGGPRRKSVRLPGMAYFPN